MIRRLASLHRLPLGAVRRLPRYYQGAMTSCRPSRRASLPSLGGTSAFTRCFRSSEDECAIEAWSWCPGISIRGSTEETTGAPKFLENPNNPFAHVPATPAGLLAPDRCGAAVWPLVIERQRLPRGVFRRSIAWLLDSLSTPRSAQLPGLHARLASGRWSGVTGRAFHPQGSDERFQINSSSFPKLAWRNRCDRRDFLRSRR